MRAVRVQNGVVLFVVLTVLLVMSLLALMLAKSAICENKMAASMRNRQLAQIATASALDEGQAALRTVGSSFGPEQVCAHLQCAIRDAGAPPEALGFMQTAAAKASATPLHTDLARLSGADASARLAVNAVYVIEDLGADALVSEGAGSQHARFFRITAAASGGTAQFIDASEIMFGLTQ